MKPEQVAELLEKLIDEKVRLTAIVNSKIATANKTIFLDDSKKKIDQLRAALVEALR